MKRMIVITTIVALTGCSSLKDLWPSRWDPNQSKIVTDIQQTARNFDCNGDVFQQSRNLSLQVEWLDIYSKTKDTRDVAKITSLMTNTVKELNDRSSKGQVSVVYCDIKKKIMIQQANTIGHMIQGRF